MCTRFYTEMSPELRPIVEKAKRSALGIKMMEKMGKPLKTEGEIFPTDMVPVLGPNKNGERSVFPMVWGYSIPGVKHPIVNARVETAPAKDVWRDGWNSRRCIIPASWYYEWEHIPAAGGKMKAGDKYLIQANGSSVLYLAGLYRMEEYREMKYPVFAVLTKEPTPELRKLHDRMPVILPENKIDEWIIPEAKAESIIQFAKTDLIIEKA